MYANLREIAQAAAKSIDTCPILGDALMAYGNPPDALASKVYGRIGSRVDCTPQEYWQANAESPTPTFAKALAEVLLDQELAQVREQWPDR